MVLAIICAAVVAAAVSAFAVYAAGRSKLRFSQERLAEKDAELAAKSAELTGKDAEIRMLQTRLETEADAHRRIEAEIRQSGEKALEEMRKAHDAALTKQIEALKAEMKAETDELLRKREEELNKKAHETFSSITGGLEKDIRNMKEAFESNRKTQAETSSAMKESLSNAIKSLEENTRSIGNKADNLADALRGQNKMQGCWGETILQKLFDNEGFIEGINYDSEVTLRDSRGNVILNDDSGSKMRPDYIVHFPDNNDVVIDSKVSLSAFVDYNQASDEAARKDAAQRNLASIREQVRRPSGKNYSAYLAPGHRMLDYTVMFIPVYSALQLAYNEDQNVWRDAFAKNVLITTEETLMPFLRMITIAWRNTEQVRNQEKIIDGATKMIERVAELVKSFEVLGKKLGDAQDAYEKCNSKLKDSGRSIVKSAKDVAKLGVPVSREKSLDDVELIA